MSFSNDPNGARRFFIRENGDRVEFADLKVGDRVKMCEPDGEVVDKDFVTVVAPSLREQEGEHAGRWTAVVEP